MEEQRLYNIEDTAKLMTRAKRPRRLLRIALFIIAIIAVLLITFFGYKRTEEKKYNKTISIAEKAFEEGDYDTAELEYLKATEIKKREPKAYKGLAYSYLAKGKFEKASETYQNLYSITQETEYKEAAELTKNNMMPISDKLAPAKGIWVSTDYNQLDSDSVLSVFLEEFLSSMRMAAMYDTSDTTLNASLYDRRTPEDSYALPATRFMLNQDYLEYMGDSNDPRSWYDTYYVKVEKNILEETYFRVFDTEDKNIDAARKSAEKRRMMYLEGDYYYIRNIPQGGLATEVKIKGAKVSGDKCLLEYDAYDIGNHGTGEKNIIDTYFAMFKKEKSDTEYRWMLQYNGKSIPEEASGGKEQKGEDIREPDADIFRGLEGETLVFTSGAGAWDTTLEMKANGEFEGFYRDTNMGDTGDGYPHGTTNYCKFKGKFANPKKISEHEYRTQLQSVEIEDEIGSENIDNGVRYVATEPYGLEGDEFILYLPGMKAEELPQEFIEWLEIRAIDQSSYRPTLKSYGLYDEVNNIAFF